MPQRRLRVVKNNRSQILLFSILTLVLTAAKPCRTCMSISLVSAH